MENENSQFDIQRYLKLFLRRKWIVIIPTVLFSIGSIFYASVQPDVYESRCVLRVERSEALDKLIGVRRVSSVSSVYQVVMQRMLSWQSVIQVIKFLELDKDLAKDDVAGLQKLYREISADTRLYGQGQDLLNVSYRGEQPELNFRIVDGLVTNFMESSLKDARAEANQTLVFIDEDMRRLKKELDESEQDFVRFEEEQLQEIPGDEGNKQFTLSAKKKALEEMDANLIALNEQLEFIDDREEEEGETRVGEVTRIANPKVEHITKQISDLELTLNNMRVKYYDEHPRIIGALKVLESLEKMLEQESEKVISEEKIVSNPVYDQLVQERFSTELAIKTLQHNRAKIEEEIVALEKSVKGMPALRQKYAKLERRFSLNKQMYNQRLAQKAKAELVKEASLNASAGIFEIVEPARISYNPLKVVKLKMVGMGVFLGLGLGLGLVFGLDFMDSRFKTVDDVKKYLDIPALGVIPMILTNTEVKRRFKKKIILSGSMAVFVVITTVVCLVVEPVKRKVNTGFDKLIELAKE
ncbi:MAG: hypothetical protein GY777_30860 [Candidatus Brocadiaceae bacterium]|nr:hypothetical protein [Candidatus Brocadiaceae bacterium]